VTASDEPFWVDLIRGVRESGDALDRAVAEVMPGALRAIGAMLPPVAEEDPA
jgi:hypothetical protein